MLACLGVWVHGGTYGAEADAGGPLLLSTDFFFFETGSVTEPGLID